MVNLLSLPQFERPVTLRSEHNVVLILHENQCGIYYYITLNFIKINDTGIHLERGK